MDLKVIVKTSIVVAFFNALYISGLEIDFLFLLIIAILFLLCFNLIHAKLYDRYDSTSFKIIKVIFSLGVSGSFIYLLGKLYLLLGFSFPHLIVDIIDEL